MEAMQERRKEQRWPSYLGGRAVLADRYPPANCIVRNTSNLGAHIELNTTGPLPPVFRLRIPCRNIEVWVQTRWRGGSEAGVEAIASRPAHLVDVELEHSLRKLDSQTDALKRHLAEMMEHPA
jgi:hypothetical protein